MSSSTAGKAPSKSASTFQSASLSPTQPQSSSSIDSGGQRRSGSSGSVGAGFAARKTVSSARNNQSSRKQHRGSRRPRFAGEDAIAESAAMKSTSSRKGQTSITHLMNFTLPPRPQYQHRLNNHNARRNPTWGLGSG
ncbi:MAG: hypothetical protein M1833_001931, partial [Piccolia ochrophora]